MRKPIIFLTAAALTVANFAYFTATPAYAEVEGVAAGRPLFDGEGKRVGAIYRVAADGSPQLIVGGKIVTVPVTSVSVSAGKIVTSLIRKQLVSR